jgi:hypothetical protein
LREAFKQFFNELEESWCILRNNQENLQFVAVEFARILPLTLLASIDVSIGLIN